MSCDDWDEDERLATCVPNHQKCDGISQCPTGKDEEDCFILADDVNVTQVSICFNNFIHSIFYLSSKNKNINFIN